MSFANNYQAWIPLKGTCPDCKTPQHLRNDERTIRSHLIGKRACPGEGRVAVERRKV